jgi:hypothetical protein
MPKRKPSKSPGRNTRVREIMQGAWVDADGNAHLDVPGVHQWMRDRGFPITDTKAEIEDTAQHLLQNLAERGFDPAKVIVRRSRKE